MSSEFRNVGTARVEVTTIQLGGRAFTALGSLVDEKRGVLVGYPKGSALHTCDGTAIAGVTLRIVSSWATPRSFMGNRMYAYRATLHGIAYHGRGFGDGCLLRLYAKRGNQ